MRKDEFLKSIGTSEEKLKAEKKEIIKFDDGDPECIGWEVRYIDEKKSIEIALGCKCSTSNSLHNKL